jgi:hypothetical protein
VSRLLRGSVAGVALLASAHAAYAQTPPLPASNEERPTFVIGGFELRPRLLVLMGVDNNVFNEPENAKRDFAIGVHPDLEVTVKPGPVKVVSLLVSDFLWYKDHESERIANRSASVNVDANLRAFRPFASFSIADTSARPSPEIDARAHRNPQTFSAGATVKIGTRTSAGAKWTHGRERYDDNEAFRGEDLATTLNNESTTIEGIFGVELTPLTSLSLVVGRDDLNFDHTAVRNATATRVLPTLTFSPAGLINGTAAVGYKHFEGDDSSMPDYKGLVMNGSVSVLLGQRYRVETQFARDIQYSYEAALPYYVLTGGRGTLATQLTSIFDVRGTVGYDRMRYQAYNGGDSPGSDRQRVYGGGIGFRIGDRKRLLLQVEFIERNSDRDRQREYTNQRIFGTFTWGA